MDSMAVLPLSGAFFTVHGRTLLCTFTFCSRSPVVKTAVTSGCGSSGHQRQRRLTEFRRPDAFRFAASGTANSVPPLEGIYTVGDFMTKREVTVDEGNADTLISVEKLWRLLLRKELLIYDDGKLVHVVSDYDLLALDSISGGAQQDTNVFPVVDSTWKTFNEIQKLLSKTNGKVVGDLMTPPLAVWENTNLEDAVRLLLKTKYHHLHVVDGEGKLIGIIMRGNIVRGALQIKQATKIM